MHRPGRDLPWKQFVKQITVEYKKDRVADQAAALTYYGLLALFPFLIFLVTFGGLLLNPERVARLIDQLARIAPSEVAAIVAGRLRELEQMAGGGLLAIAVIGSLWAASSGVASLMRALNRAYEVEETRPFWKVRLIALAVTLGASVLALASALAMLLVPPLAHRLGGPLATILSASRFVAGGLLMMVFLAVLYYFLPNVRGRFRVFTFGAIAAVPLWLLASWAFGLYVSHFGKFGAVYGALGGVVVLMVWMWISSQVVLLGAEMNKILTPWRELHGPRRARSVASHTLGPGAPQPA